MVEVEEQAQELWGKSVHPDVVLCPIGGGGLASGVAIASKGYWGTGGVRVIGVEPAGKCSRLCAGDRDLSVFRTSGANDAHGGFYTKVWQPAIAPIKTACDGLLTATGHITYPALLANVRTFVFVMF